MTAVKPQIQRFWHIFEKLTIPPPKKNNNNDDYDKIKSKNVCLCVCWGVGGGYETRLRVLAFTLAYDFPVLLHSKSSFVPTQLKDIIFASILRR